MVFKMLRFITQLVVRPYKPKRRPSKSVAIVVPLSSRNELLPEEEVSLQHLLHFLDGYDKYFVAPPDVSVPQVRFKVLNFDRKFFGSAAAHNQLLLWPGFYRTFENYEFILIYHLDSLVLVDAMAQWCQRDFDYIGAPWLPCSDTPWVKEARVGNGGFTLMKVEAVLKVLYNRYRIEPASYWLDILMRNSSRLRHFFWALERLQRLFPRSRLINRPLEDLRKSEKPGIYGCNNDFFWSFQAAEYLPEFKIPTVEEALYFAFEAAPRRCFELTGGQMPFGCHAWTKFDRSFWEPHLLKVVEDSVCRAKTRDYKATISAL